MHRSQMDAFAEYAYTANTDPYFRPHRDAVIFNVSYLTIYNDWIYQLSSEGMAHSVTQCHKQFYFIIIIVFSNTAATAHLSEEDDCTTYMHSLPLLYGCTEGGQPPLVLQPCGKALQEMIENTIDPQQQQNSCLAITPAPSTRCKQQTAGRGKPPNASLRGRGGRGSCANKKLPPIPLTNLDNYDGDEDIEEEDQDKQQEQTATTPLSAVPKKRKKDLPQQQYLNRLPTPAKKQHTEPPAAPADTTGSDTSPPTNDNNDEDGCTIITDLGGTIKQLIYGHS